MSSYDYIAIDAGDVSLAAVAETLGARQVDDGYEVLLGEGVVGSLYAIDLVADAAVDWRRFPYEVAVQSRDVQTQETAASRLYDRLVALTDWALVLAFDEGVSVRAARPALETA